MTITRTKVEAVLIRRCGKALAAVDLDGTTTNGNADLNDPIWDALRQLGYSVADISAVTDADLAAVSTDDERALLDIAELRTLETCRSAAVVLVNFSYGPRSEQLSQLASGLEKAIEAKRQAVKDAYGLGGGSLEAGVFSVATQEDGSEVTE